MANWKEPPFSKAKMEGIHQRQANRMRTASPAMLKKQTEEYLIVIEREDRKNGNTRNMDYWNWMNTDLNYRKVKVSERKSKYRKRKLNTAQQEKRETERMLNYGANG